MSKVLPKVGTNEQGKEMSTATAVAKTLERRERQRVPTVAEARRRIADRAKIGVGTFENIVRGRVKRVDAAVRDRLQVLLVQDLQQEIARQTHELELHRQTGARLDASEVTEVEACLAKAKALLDGRVE